MIFHLLFVYFNRKNEFEISYSMILSSENGEFSIDEFKKEFLLIIYTLNCKNNN
jgi:hypothetical protein